MDIAFFLIGSRFGEMGGVETYLRNLVTHLVKLRGGHAYTLLLDRGARLHFDDEGWQVGTMELDYRRRSFNRFLRSALRKTVGADLLRSRVDRMGMDVVHFPFSVMNPLGLKTPTVLTFHDMQHEYFPEFFSPRELSSRKKWFRASAEAATLIIAISAFSKRTLIERFAVPEGKIAVVYQGIGEEYRTIEDRRRLEEAKERYGLTRPFMFYPAASWPHKNHGNLIRALKILLEESSFDGDLVLSGISKRAHENIHRAVRESGASGRVRFLGYLHHRELPLLYNLATLMVFPSIFEGFGIPLVEAMACGCPIVCSNVTSIPEVVGEAAVQFDPRSPEDMAEKIISVWEDGTLQERLREKGRSRHALFNWEAAARKTEEVYEKAWTMCRKKSPGRS